MTDKPKFNPNPDIQFSFGELYQVKSELKEYKLRNISRIVNVLGGQFTEITNEHEEITEEDSYNEFERESIEESSITTSTNEAMESVADSYQDKSSAFSVSGSVKASYGTIKAQVDSSYDNQNDKGSSQSNAQSYAKEVVEQSRKSVRTRVLKQHRLNVQIRDFESKKTGFDNRGGSNFVGIYRHISEVHEAKLIKHQKHMFGKISLPYPAANYTNYISGALTASTKSPTGLKFDYNNDDKNNALTFENLIKPIGDEDTPWIDKNWIKLAAKFGLEDPIPYPSDLYQNKAAVKESTDIESVSESYSSRTLDFDIPEGFLPNNIAITPVVGHSGVAGRTLLRITLPNKKTIDLGTNYYENSPENNLTFNLDNNTGSFTDNKMSVGFQTGWTYEFHINCLVTYTASEDTLNLWRLNFYNQILEASEGKPTPEDKLGISRRVNVLANADAAKKLIEEEIQRGVIQYVLGTDLKGFDAYSNPSPDKQLDYPEIDIDKTNDLQPIVGFLSSAFDFDKMSYRFLPNYLGDEKNRDRLYDSKNMGLVRDFLQAGWAEVILPIRRGEEYKLFYLMETGLFFSGSNDEAPLPNKREYLALTEEIEADKILSTQNHGEETIDTWEFYLPTAFEILQDGADINASVPEAVVGGDIKPNS